MSATSANTTTLWSQELANETQVWMRYLTFRPWYEDKSVADVGSTTRFGANYASVLASSVELFALPENLQESTSTEEHFGLVPIHPEDVATSNYDVVLCFEALNSTSDPERLLRNLAACTGQLAIGYTPDGKWSFDSFSALVEEVFEDRSVRFVFQSPNWPYRLNSEDTTDSLMWVAVIGEEKPISWPNIGFAMPTFNNPTCVQDAVLGLTRSYPGNLHVAVVANGCDSESLGQMNGLAQELQNDVTLVNSDTNLGYGQGSNRGLEHLTQISNLDYYGVINDDILPDPDCVCELVAGMMGLEELGLSPGVIGPVSNNVNGLQQVDVGPFQSYSELLDRVATYRRAHHASVTQVRQLRGLMFLIHPQCLEVVGGFDPIFGIGNFEDDDHNIRTHLAGFSLWIADGAFLYHHGSTTFQKLDVSYEANIQRNMEALFTKWQMRRANDDWMAISELPSGVNLKIDLNAWDATEKKHMVTINGEAVDLIQQATDLEFAAWVMKEIQNHPREYRRTIIATLSSQLTEAA